MRYSRLLIDKIGQALLDIEVEGMKPFSNVVISEQDGYWHMGVEDRDGSINSEGDVVGTLGMVHFPVCDEEVLRLSPGRWYCRDCDTVYEVNQGLIGTRSLCGHPVEEMDDSMWHMLKAIHGPQMHGGPRLVRVCRSGNLGLVVNTPENWKGYFPIAQEYEGVGVSGVIRENTTVPDGPMLINDFRLHSVSLVEEPLHESWRVTGVTAGEALQALDESIYLALVENINQEVTTNE